MNEEAKKMIEMATRLEEDSYKRWLGSAKSEASEINRYMKHLESADYDDISALKNIISLASDAIYALTIAHAHYSNAAGMRTAVYLINSAEDKK